MDNQDFYVLYCCKICHRQFEEKGDLMTHYCKTSKIDVENIKFLDIEKEINTESKKDKTTEHVDSLQHNMSSPVETAKGFLLRKQPSKRSATSALETNCDKISSSTRSKNEATPDNSTISDKTSSRSRRQIKRTEKFVEYLRDRDSQSETIQKNIDKKHSKNEIVRFKIRILDDDKISKRKDFEETDSNICSNNENEVHDKQIIELENAIAGPENVNTFQDNFSQLDEVKHNVEDPDETLDIVNKKRKRKSSLQTGSIPVKSKKMPDVVVTLKDYPESYSMEDYISPDPADKGKSVKDKTCQRYLCKLCNGYRTVNEKQMEKHVALHVNKRLDCRHCGVVFNSLHNLSHHERQEHHEKALFICEHCGDDFSEKRLYKKHLSHVHKEAAFTCTICQKQFLTNQEYKQHRLDEHKNSAFKCENCDNIFVSEKMLERHKENKVCEIKLFACQECGTIKKSQAILDEHVRKIHSKEHCYKCNLCTYSTGQQYMMKHHMRAHLGIHPHKCDLCSFTCVKKWQLVSHMRTHSREKKYKCKKCNYAAAWNVQVKTHMQAHESDAREICKPCNIVFKDMKSLRTHLWKEHGESRKRKSDMTIHRPNFGQDNISMIVGTNLAVYNSKKSVKTSLQTSGSDTPLLVCVKEEHSDSEIDETDVINEEVAPVAHQHSALTDEDTDHLIKCPGVLSLLKSPTVNSFAETVVGRMSGNFVSAGEQGRTIAQASTQSTEVQKHVREKSNLLNKGQESAITDNTIPSEAMIQTTPPSQRVNSLKTVSNATKQNDSNIGINVPLVNNKKVTLLRMHRDPDGRSRFETVVPGNANLTETLPITVSAQEVHNYAVPIHKRVKKMT